MSKSAPADVPCLPLRLLAASTSDTVEEDVSAGEDTPLAGPRPVDTLWLREAARARLSQVRGKCQAACGMWLARWVRGWEEERRKGTEWGVCARRLKQQ
mmetsp:Transcript_10837/g.39771  ORF Transcript_10837/g.39771 Transcript_10837/m.39771 type:complete len:99 (-) Transcript_10837:111-407(-)